MGIMGLCIPADAGKKVDARGWWVVVVVGDGGWWWEVGSMQDLVDAELDAASSSSRLDSLAEGEKGVGTEVAKVESAQVLWTKEYDKVCR